MTVLAAFRDGMRRVASAPAVLLGTFVVTLLLTVPLAQTLRAMLAAHLGASRAAETALDHVDYNWWQEYTTQATGIGTTFTPTILGFGAVLDNLSGFLDNRQLTTVMAGAATAYIVVWIFFVGGVIDRYARNRPTRSIGFFSASGVFFFRFLRLAIVGWIVYALLFRYVHRWLFDTVYVAATRNMTVERNGFLVLVTLYVVFGAVLCGFNLLFDYAKIRAVVEDRHSMLGALAAAWRFIARHPMSAAGLYLANGLLFVLVLAAYALVAPGAGGPSPWFGFLIGQLYILARLWVKLGFYASQTSMFQGLLAHAEYTAAPPPVWPESPAAEAIRNAAWQPESPASEVRGPEPAARSPKPVAR
jgi:hypothetical protein